MRADTALLLLALFGCGERSVPEEPGVPEPAPRAVTLVQTVPTDTSGFELADVPHTDRVWLDMIAGARQSVDVASFYVANHSDGRLEAVLAEMERAAHRGVRVRLLVDAAFADKYPAELERLASTISVRRLDLRERTGGVQHAKYLVVDERELYIGSANFDWRSLEHIHEIGVRVDVAEMARQLGALFLLDWHMAGGDTPPPSAMRWPMLHAGAQHLRLLASPKGLLVAPDAWDLPVLIRAVEQARRSIDVQLLTYHAAHRDESPWNELHTVLLRAGERGVRVRLVLSHWQQAHMTAIRELQRATNIDVALVQVPEHAGGFIPFARVVHAKYMVVDDELSWVGTSNWQGDYFYKSRNVGVLVTDTALGEQLGGLFDGVFGGPYAHIVDPERDYPEPRIAH